MLLCWVWMGWVLNGVGLNREDRGHRTDRLVATGSDGWNDRTTAAIRRRPDRHGACQDRGGIRLLAFRDRGRHLDLPGRLVVSGLQRGRLFRAAGCWKDRHHGSVGPSRNDLSSALSKGLAHAF